MNGILLIDKPADWTSNDVVMKLKGVLHERRIGHSGTLDPMATGLLVVFVGRATRAVEFAEAHAKRYLASLRLGLVTDTQDITGTVLEAHPANITPAELENALCDFRGETDQLPPMYSAIKVNGKKLYDIARKGGEAERKTRRITVSSLELVGRESEDWQLDISCSKGTYIRTLCHDIGAKLGCGGCMSALRRVKAGAFDISQAHTLSEVIEAAQEGRAETLLLPTDALFSDKAKITATAKQEQRIRVGAPFSTELPDGEYRVYSQTGEFLALSGAADGTLTTIKSFFEVSHDR